MPYGPNVKKATNVRKAVAAIPGVLVDGKLDPPAWIGAGAREVGRDIVVCASAALNLPTGELAAPPPELCATSALDVEWIAEAETPTEWLHFPPRLVARRMTKRSNSCRSGSANASRRTRRST